MNLPDEIELLSIFESEPKLSDKAVPYFYNLVKYYFTNQSKQNVQVTLQPSCNEFSIQIIDSKTKIADLNFKTINTLSILADNEQEKKIMLIGDNLGVKITIQPQFKIDLQSKSE